MGITAEEFEKEIRNGLREDQVQDAFEFFSGLAHCARTKLSKAIKARNVESTVTPEGVTQDETTEKETGK